MKRAAGARTVALAFTLACGGGGGTSPPRDGGAGAADAAALDATAARSPQSCLDVRNCVQLCKDDACAQACVDAAPAAAQQKYRAVDACARGACAQGELDCRCAAECIFPGACTAEVEECNDGMQDRFCDLCF